MDPISDVAFRFRNKRFLIDRSTWRTFELSEHDWAELDASVLVIGDGRAYELPFEYRVDDPPPEVARGPDVSLPIVAPGHYVIYLSTGCNMGCGYCWNDGGEIYGNAERMTLARADELVEFILEHSSIHGKLSITFMGGEPLLAYEALERLIRELDARFPGPVEYDLETNGTLLDAARAEFLRDHKVRTNVSIDGPPALNRFRVFKSGKPTFDQVIERLKVADSVGMPFDLSVTLTKEAVPRLEDTVAWLESTFAAETTHIVLSRVRHDMFLPEGHDAALSWVDRKEYYDRYAELMMSRYYVKGIVPRIGDAEVMEKMKQVFFAGSGDPAGRYCGLVNAKTAGNLVVTPNGSLYPCHRWTEPERVVGTISGGVQPHAAYGHLDLPEECTGCWARRLCGGGGCPAGNRRATGSASRVDPGYCSELDYVVKLSVYMLSCLPLDFKVKLFPLGRELERQKDSEAWRRKEAAFRHSC
ncbi:MAG: radical SAM protein [Deltaproteobacteria bacterium]|nr:radical SAM protein [Deltaproteobacteria bacterium]